MNRNLPAAPGISGPRRARGGFANDVRGFVSVEFAMIGAPLLCLIGAILVTALVYAEGIQLQAATQSAAHAAFASSAANRLTANQFVDDYVCPKLTAPFDCRLLQVRVQSASNWGAAGEKAPNPL